MGEEQGAEEHRTLKDGRYTLLSVLGEGGMAHVWRARDERLGVERAIKIIRGEGRAARVRSRRLVAEARAMARIQHPHIVAVHDVIEDGATPAIVMDLVEGGTLDEVLKSSGPLAPRHACVWMLQILGALQAAHLRGIVHRDVKPSNVLVDGEGRAMLADFGIALLSDEDRHTRTGVTMGSVAYMAPEQRLDARSVEPTADVYAAGSTLFHLLTGATPVDLFTADESSPRWLDVPEPLREVLYRATRLDPATRFPTARAFAEAIEGTIDALDDVTDDDAAAWLKASRFEAATAIAEQAEQRVHDPSGRLLSMGGTLVADDGPTEADEGAPLWLALVGAGVVLLAVLAWWGAGLGAWDAPSQQAPDVRAAVVAPATPDAPPGASEQEDPEEVPAKEVPTPTPPPDEPARPRKASSPPSKAPPEARPAPEGSTEPPSPVSDAPASAVAGMWMGDNGAVDVDLSLEGPDDDLRGTLVLHLPGGPTRLSMRGAFASDTGAVTLRTTSGRAASLSLTRGGGGTQLTGALVAGAKTQPVVLAR